MTHLKELGIEASIIEKSNSPLHYEVKFIIPSPLRYFEGHFPENPVLPAFASIEISLALGRHLKIIPDKINKISNAKFLAVIKPKDLVVILIKTYESSIGFEWYVEDTGNLKKACDLSVEKL